MTETINTLLHMMRGTYTELLAQGDHIKYNAEVVTVALC